MLDLNETQTAVLSLVFRFCDDRDLPLLDLADVRTTLRFLTSDEGKPVGSGDTATNTISGTSMATPHVPGRGRHPPPDEPDCDTCPGRLDDHLERDAGGRQEPRVRLAEPPAVLGLHGVPAVASASSSAPPPPPEPGTFTLTASGQTFFATVKLVTLTWTGATSQYMSLFRDGGNIGAAANTGSFTDVVMTSGGTIVLPRPASTTRPFVRTRPRSRSEPNAASDGAGPYNRGQRR